MSLSDDDRALLADLRERLAGCGELQEMRLFGPRARGDGQADLDLCLVFTTVDAALRAAVERQVWQTGFDHGVTICPLLCSSAEFAAAGTSILVRIRSEGLRA